MRTHSSTTKSIRVLMMPDYRIDNPYQSLLTKALQDEGVEVEFPVGYRRMFPILRATKARSAGFDVLHLHWLSPYLKGENRFFKFVYCIKFLIDILLVRWAGVRVVWTIHNHLSHDAKFPWLEQWTQRILVKLVDRIILHSPSALDEIAQAYSFDSSKAEVIPHGHYQDVYGSAINSLEAREALELPKSGRIYLNLGMLRPYKGIERLLQVWQDNKEILAGNTILIAGQALNEAYGRKLSEQVSEIDGAILHANFVEDRQIYLYFSAADLVVLPFKRILTSGSLILAMSYGKPIIAPRLQNLTETLGEADWLLYDPNDEQGLLHAIKDSNEVDLSALSQLVSEACDHLNWNKIAQKTQQLYQAVV